MTNAHDLTGMELKIKRIQGKLCLFSCALRGEKGERSLVSLVTRGCVSEM